MQQTPDHRFCVAPMMDWTDRHCRYFHRRLSRHARLYTEMITSAAIRYGDRDRLLSFHADEHPVALQLGGSDPDDLAHASEIGIGYGYDEINLNCGCPSDRVQSGRFGACLMAEPALVAECVASMKSVAGASIPVTVKCRIGIDDQDSEADLSRFVEHVANVGCSTVIVHARKAWLKGLSPKENRDVPPLDYDRVYRLKRTFPELTIVINGGVGTLSEASIHLQAVNGVMLGRAAYKTPALLAEVDAKIFGSEVPIADAETVVADMIPYVTTMLAEGERLSAITRHMLGLINGQPGARHFRRLLTEESVKPGAGPEVLQAALDHLRSLRHTAVRVAA